jgi:purine-cytosine permease-like protein
MTSEHSQSMHGSRSTEGNASPRTSDTFAASPARQPPGRRRRGRIAIGLLQLIALIGIVGLAVIAGAILVEDTSVPGWIDGLAIGAGSVILTVIVLFNGRRARHP